MAFMANKNRLRKLFGISVIVIALGYILSLVLADPQVTKRYITSFPLDVFIVSSMLSTLAGAVNAYVWHRISWVYNPQVCFANSYWAWSVGRVYRYVPGKVAGYVVRHKLQASGLADGVRSSINEYVITLIPVAILALLYFSLILGNQWGSVIISLGAFFLLLNLRFMLRYVGKYVRRFHDIPDIEQLIFSPIELIKSTLTLLPAMLLHGASFYVLLKYGMGEESYSYVYATAALYLSGILGQLSLLSPAGLGVREAALSMMLSASGVDGQLAVGAALLSRIVLLMSEVINILLALWLRSVQKYRKI